MVCCELSLSKALLQYILVPHPQPVRLICDNQTAIHIASNPVFHEQTKHIEFDCHLVWENFNKTLSRRFMFRVSTMLQTS